MDINNTPNTTDHIMTDDKLTLFVVDLGLFYNIFLALGKTIVGIIGHSGALLADGINSTSDVVYYIAVKIFLKIANKPADKEHPFGHKQMELIASIVIAAFIITTALVIAWNSIDKIFDIVNGEQSDVIISIFTLYIAAFTVLSKVFLTIYTSYIGKKTQNPAVSALASDHLNDIFAAAAVVVGIIFAVRGQYWVDPLAGVIVSFFILRTGVEILKDAANGLMDVSPSDDMKAMVDEYIDSLPEKILIESILSHRYGIYYSLNITLAIDGTMTMKEADTLANKIEQDLIAKDKYLIHIFIHYHIYPAV